MQLNKQAQIILLEEDRKFLQQNTNILVLENVPGMSCIFVSYCEPKTCGKIAVDIFKESQVL